MASDIERLRKDIAIFKNKRIRAKTVVPGKKLDSRDEKSMTSNNWNSGWNWRRALTQDLNSTGFAFHSMDHPR